MTMTLHAAQTQLAASVEDLWAHLAELVVITLDDQPEPNAPMAFDDLVNEVSEIEGAVDAVRTGIRDESSFAARLPEIAVSLDSARSTYWRTFRSFDSVARLRVAARRRNGKWPGWLDSVEKSADACEKPFDAATAALHVCWQEVVS
jgi:hypothetical protein